MAHIYFYEVLALIVVVQERISIYIVIPDVESSKEIPEELSKRRAGEIQPRSATCGATGLSASRIFAPAIFMTPIISEGSCTVGVTNRLVHD
jgi:hypothetical protein